MEETDMIQDLKSKCMNILLKSDIGKIICYNYIKTFKSIKPVVVHIETTNECNRSCGYCPVSTQRKPAHQMPIETVWKIIDDLSMSGYYGAVYPYGFGEALLDSRISNIINYARIMLPDNKIILYTNGDYLTPIIFEKLIKSGLDELQVSMHTFIPEEKRIKSEKIIYSNYSDESIKLNNRAGNINIPIDRLIPKIQSCWAVQTMFIDSYGYVRLCCNDYHSTEVYGNVNDTPIMNIWNRTKYIEDRNRVASGFFEKEICKKCITK